MINQPPLVNNRRELFDYLDYQMARHYRDILNSSQLEKDGIYLKTLMLEFDWNPSKLNESESNFLTKALTIKNKQSIIAPTVYETVEKGFFVVDWEYSKSQVRIYLDTTTDRRFWLAYSISNSVPLDKIVKNLSNLQTNLDKVWLWPKLLENTQGLGEFRGFGLNYDRRNFDRNEGESDSKNYFKVQLWGGPDSKKTLDFLSENDPKRSVLSKIRMRYWDQDEEGKRIEESFAVEDIKFDGKLTTRGTSFEAHQILVSQLREKYSEKIRYIENKHTIKNSAENYNDELITKIEGQPIFFVLDQEDKIQNLDKFCEVVFSGTLPFRLWGIPEPTLFGGNGRTVQAVDLHTGSKMSFEIYPEIICMYLYRGCCGNSAARFFTNMQQRFSHRITAEDNDENIIF